MFAEDFCNGVAYGQFLNEHPHVRRSASRRPIVALAVAQFDSAWALRRASSNKAYLQSRKRTRVALQGDYHARRGAARCP
jgi:hypothetical protein